MPPGSHPPLQRVKLSGAISSGVARLELDEKLERGLIRPLFQTVHHLLPVLFEDVGPAAARFVAETPIRFWSNDHAPRASILAPAIDAPQQRFVLPPRKSARELDAQLFEQLRSADVREIFESAAHDRPHHAQRLDLGMAGLGVDRRRSLKRLCRRCDRSARRRRRFRFYGERWMACLRKDVLQTSQVTRLGFDGEGRTDLAGAPCAREACHERGQIGWFGRRLGRSLAVGERRQVSLHGAHFFEQLQRIELGRDLPQLVLSGCRDAVCLQESLAGRLRWMVALGHSAPSRLLAASLNDGWKKFTNSLDAP